MIAGVLLALAACSDYRLGDPDEQVTTPVRVQERFVQAPYPALDVLFVIDSTGSMAEEQAGFAAAAGRFVAGLDALEVSYQLGVTTTDPADAGALQGLPWIVTPTADDPAARLADAIEVGTASPPPSAGLDAAALALADPDGQNRGFRRDDAALHVVFVADGDDESGAVLGDDPVGALLAVLDAEAARTGRATRASAVVGDVPSGCSGPGGAALPGARYVEVAEATGGAVASICTSDFGAVADAVGELGVEWQRVFPLQAEPEVAGATVTVDGVRVTGGWCLDTTLPALVFDAPPAADAAIVVEYALAGGEG